MKRKGYDERLIRKDRPASPRALLINRYSFSLATRHSQPATRNSQLATRNSQLATPHAARLACNVAPASPAATPKFTTNRAATPAAVERTATI